MGKLTGSKRKAKKAPARKRKPARKRPAAKKPAPCKHTHAYYEQIRSGESIRVMGCYAIFGGNDPQFGYGEHRQILSARCTECGEWLSLGNAHETEEVRVEMRAAELEAWIAVDELHIDEFALMEVDGWKMWIEGGDLVGKLADEIRRLIDPGWLAGEIYTADTEGSHDADAWPWDPTRPVAGQYEKQAVAAHPTVSLFDFATGSTDRRFEPHSIDPDSCARCGCRSGSHSVLDGACPIAVTNEADDPLTECCPRKQWGDGEHDAGCRSGDPDLQAGGPALTTAEIIAAYIDPPLTVTIDSATAVQLNGLDTAPPLFTPDEAEELADDLLLGADAARQAAKDGYRGPAVVVELLVGEEPEQGAEFEPTVRCDHVYARSKGAWASACFDCHADPDIVMHDARAQVAAYEVAADLINALLVGACTSPHDGDCEHAVWSDGPPVCVVPMRKTNSEIEADYRRRIPPTAVTSRLTESEAAECAALSDSDVCEACGDKWMEHGQTCAGSLNSDDIPMRAGAASYVGMTPRERREMIAEGIAEENKLRDPEVMARNARLLARRAAAGAKLTDSEILDIADAVERGKECGDG